MISKDELKLYAEIGRKAWRGGGGVGPAFEDMQPQTQKQWIDVALAVINAYKENEQGRQLDNALRIKALTQNIRPNEFDGLACQMHGHRWEFYPVEGDYKTAIKCNRCEKII